MLVVGATGRQGGAVVRELLSRGTSVRGLTRDSSSAAARELRRLGADLAQGDLEDRASLDRALADVWGVYAMQDFWEHGFEGEVRQGRNLADAAHAAGVGHFLYSSVGSADRETGVPHFESKYRIEEHIRSLGVRYTILRPVTFMYWEPEREEILSGELRGALRPETRQQFIDLSDLGRLAADVFEDPDAWAGVELDVAGDELSMIELAEVFSRVTGRRIEYVQVPLEDMEPELAKMLGWFEAVGYDADVEGLRERYPWLHDVEAHLERTGWHAPPEGSR